MSAGVTIYRPVVTVDAEEVVVLVDVPDVRQLEEGDGIVLEIMSTDTGHGPPTASRFTGWVRGIQALRALHPEEGEHAMPASWAVLPWRANGDGYAGQGPASGVNSRRERVWFSPSCHSAGLWDAAAVLGTLP